MAKRGEKHKPGSENTIPCMEWLDYQIEETEEMLQQMYKLREEVWK